MSEVKNGFDISAENYIKAAQTLAAVAHNVTRLPIPEATVSTWEQIMYAIRIGDDRIDKIGDQEGRTDFKRRMMGFLRNDPHSDNSDGVLGDAMVNLRHICDSLDRERRTLLLKTFDKLLLVTESLRHTSDIHHFSLLTRLEGQITSRLFLSVLPEGYGNPGTRRKLYKAFTRFGRFANVFDSFTDLPDDSAEGLTKVNPSLINRGRLLVNSLPDAVVVLAHIHPTINLIGQIGRRAMETSQNNPHRGKQVSIGLQELV